MATIPQFQTNLQQTTATPAIESGDAHLKKLDEVDNLWKAHLPSIADFIFAPITLIKKSPCAIRAVNREFDQEGWTDIMLGQRGHLSFFYAACTLFRLILPSIIHLIHNTHWIGFTLKVLVPFAGFLLFILETVTESISLKRLYDLDIKLNNKEKIKSYETIINDYFSISNQEKEKIAQSVALKFSDAGAVERVKQQEKLTKEVINIKECNAARRIRPWAVVKIKEKIRFIDAKLKSNSTQDQQEVLACIDEILALVHEQKLKKVMVHIIGLVSVAFTIAGVISTLAGAPVLAIITLHCISALYSTVRSLLVPCFLELEGWTFDIKKSLPPCIQQRIAKSQRRDGLATVPPLSSQRVRRTRCR